MLEELLELLKEIAANTRDAKEHLKDIRRINYNIECSAYLRQDGCDHAIGVLSGSYKLLHISDSDRNKANASNSFVYCPKCGKKL